MRARRWLGLLLAIVGVAMIAVALSALLSVHPMPISDLMLLAAGIICLAAGLVVLIIEFWEV